MSPPDYIIALNARGHIPQAMQRVLGLLGLKIGWSPSASVAGVGMMPTPISVWVFTFAHDTRRWIESVSSETTAVFVMISSCVCWLCRSSYLGVFSPARSGTEVQQSPLFFPHLFSRSIDIGGCSAPDALDPYAFNSSTCTLVFIHMLHASLRIVRCIGPEGPLAYTLTSSFQSMCGQ